MIQDKIFFDEKDPTGLSYNTPFTYFGSYQGRLWSKAPGGEIKYYTQNSDLSVYATTGSNQFNGNQAITGSLTVTGGIIGTTATSSYVEYSNVANKPTLVSGSSQVSFNGITNKPTLVSGSSQISFNGITNKPTLVSSSVQVKEYNVFATTGSNGFNGSQSITGSLTVTGQVVAQTLNVQQVTSSVVYSSGSNIFGNELGNTQQFTGSLQVTGSSHYLLGSVGVGTTTPEGKLTIQGTAAELPNSGTTANSLIQLKSNLNTELNLGLNTVSGDYGAYIQASDNNLGVPYGLHLQPNGGNVGIGTIKARGLLHLFGPEIAAYKTYTGQGNTLGGDTIINAYRLDASSAYLRVTDIVALGDDVNNRGSSIRLMTTNTSGVTSAALTLASTGAATFSSSVTAVNAVLGNTSNNTNAIQFLDANSTKTHLGSAFGATFIQNNNFYNGSAYVFDDNTIGSANITLSAGTINFQTGAANVNPSTKLTMLTNGNVGIGTTNPVARLQVSNTSDFTAILKVSDLGTESTGIIALGDGNSSALNVGIWRGAANSLVTYGNWLNLGGYDGVLFSTGAAGIGSQTERMRITSGGYLKASNDAAYLGGNLHEFLSNTANSYTLIVSNKAASPASTYIQDWRFTASTPNNSSARFWNCEDATANRAHMRSDGGLVNYQANDVNLSDERTKKDITLLESYWNKFKAIEIVKFKYKDQTHDDFNIGVIAQQVESVAPEFVDVDGWDTKPKLDEEGNEIVSTEEPLKSIYTADLYHATIKVLQEAMAKIEILEAKIQTLEQQ